MKNAGYDVSIIAQCEKNITIEGIEIIAVKLAKSRFERFFLVVPKMIIAAFEHKAKVYHFHDPDLLVAGLLLKIFTGSKVIYDVHEDVPRQILSKYWLPRITRKPCAFLFGFFEKITAKLFDAVIIASSVLSKNFSGGKIVCVANYPRQKMFSCGTFRQKNLFQHKRFTAIYVGGLEKIRGINEIVKAASLAAELFPIDLVLAGNFPDKKFAMEVSGTKEWKKIKFLGQISYDSAVKQIFSANVGLACLHPIERFVANLPVKMFEYMAAGIPVIASDFPLWKEIIESNKCGICVDPDNPEAISKAIVFLAKNPDLAEEMGKNGRWAVLEAYNWEKESEKLLDIYKFLTKNA